MATGTPGRLDAASVTGGTYVLHWYVEMFRTTAGGGNRMLARLRTTLGSVSISNPLAHMRIIQNIENGSTTAMPADTDFVAAGEVMPWAGSVVFTISAGATVRFEFEYGMDNNANINAVLRVRRQRLLLMRLGP